MTSYILIKNPKGGEISSTYRSDGWSIPFAPDNRDYQQFKVDISNGVELQDPDGNVMTPEQVQEFLSTLP